MQGRMILNQLIILPPIILPAHPVIDAAAGHIVTCVLILMKIARLLLALVLSTAAVQAQSTPDAAGLQLYSLRSQFTLRGVPWTLDRVKEFGIQEVELAGTYNLSPAAFRALLDERGLKAVSSHFPYKRYKDDLENVVKDAQALGIRFAGCAWIDHKDAFDEAECREAAAGFFVDRDVGGVA